MADAVVQSSTPEGLAQVPSSREPLARLWSVQLPRWLDPWAPQLADAFADGTWTAGWRRVAGIAPFAALAIGLFAPFTWPGIHYVYSESLYFMALAIVGAILSGPVGVMLCLGFVLGDLLADLGRGFYASSPLRVGGSQLISYLLLAILSIRVPQVARRLTEGVPLPADPAVRLAIRACLYPVASGLLVYLWCQAMVVLIRPVFTWVGDWPTVAAISQVQVRWYWLVGAAALASAARIVLEGMTAVNTHRAQVVPDLQQERWGDVRRRGELSRRLPALVRIGLLSATITLLLSGIYESWLDPLIVMLVTGGLGVWRAGLIGLVPLVWVKATNKVPALVRFVAALLVGLLVAHPVLHRMWGTGFRSVLLAGLVCLAAFYLLFPRQLLAQPSKRR